jgi:ribosomal protein S18 acetylase RimI-like enzyme
MAAVYVGARMNICLRGITDCDFERLKKSHAVLPITYDNDFFLDVCRKQKHHFGLCAEGGKDDSSFAGFATARQMPIATLCYNDTKALALSKIPLANTSQILYILTIGVDPDLRRLGVGHKLVEGILMVCYTPAKRVHGPPSLRFPARSVVPVV